MAYNGGQMDALQVENLVKSYGAVRALRGVSFAVAAGEVFGYLGPNGAGKTTTLRAVLGLARPGAGVVRILGERAGSAAARRGAVEELFKSLPPFVQAAAIVLAAWAVAGEIEDGVLELVLSQPVSRAEYLGAHVLFGLGTLAGLSLAGCAGTALGSVAFGVKLGGAGGLLRLAGMFFLLQAAWFGVTLAVSAFGREGGRAAGIGFLLALVSYLGQAVGKLLPSASFILTYCLHDYYEPRAIPLAGAVAGKSLALLLGVAAAGLAVAFARFLRRDIP